jgi:hypothetical protein
MEDSMGYVFPRIIGCREIIHVCGHGLLYFNGGWHGACLQTEQSAG